MIIVELPVIFTENYKDVVKAEESGIDIEAIETVERTTFFLLKDCLMRLNQSDNRSNFVIEDVSYAIDLDYESCLLVITEAIKRGN